MKKIGLHEIVKMDNPALTSVIRYWKDYSVSSVLLAYAELKRRNYSLEEFTKSIEEFCKNEQLENIDDALSSALHNIQYNSYEMCYEKVVATAKLKPQLTLELLVENEKDYKKYPALRTISSIQKAYAYLLLIATILISIIFFNSSFGFGIMVLSIGLLITIIAFAISESIMVLIDIEDNTRKGKIG